MSTSRETRVPASFDHGPEEPLEDSAPLAWREAPRRCIGSCMSYHRVWQYLRWLGLITSIRTNTDFLVRTFQSRARQHPRVLISGTADYGMLAHLRHAYRGAALDTTVVDRCPTPLFLNQWYADRFGLAVHTVQSDVLAYAPDAPFDLIATHNFLGRFGDLERRRLVSGWARWLRSGGVVVTTQRVRPGASAGVTRYLAREADELAVRAHTAAAAAGLPPDDADALRDAVRDYASLKASAVIQSPAQITSVFEGCGFEVELVDQGGGAAERNGDRPSSTAGRDTYRMRLVARRI